MIITMHPLTRLTSQQFIKSLIALLCISFSSIAFAGRPLTTDDASMLDEGGCQLESWTQRSGSDREYWVMPGCNFFGPFELALGQGRVFPAGDFTNRDWVLQTKTVFFEAEGMKPGLGMVAGIVSHEPGHASIAKSKTYYVTFPVSFELIPEVTSFHLNVGATHDTASKSTDTTFGIAIEHQLIDRMQVLAEVFGNHRSQPNWQIGMRWVLVPDAVTLDATIGRQYKTSQSPHWVSFGFRIATDKLF